MKIKIILMSLLAGLFVLIVGYTILAILIPLSYYYPYLSGGKRRSNYKPFFVFLSFIALIPLGIFYISILTSYAFFVIFILTVASLIVINIGSSCVEEKIANISEYEVYVCTPRARELINAWVKKDKIYVSKRMYEVLSDNELLSVIEHELGHLKNKSSNVLNSILVFLWIFWGVSSIFTMTTVAPVDVEVILKIVLRFLSSAILSFVLILFSWFLEHEADANVSDPETLAIALLKLYVSRSIGDFYQCIRMDVDIKGLLDRVEVSRIDVIRELVKASLLTIMRMGSLGFITNPLYITHPPLIIRIYFLSRILKSVS